MPRTTVQTSTLNQKSTIGQTNQGKFVNSHYETEFDNRECHN